MADNQTTQNIADLSAFPFVHFYHVCKYTNSNYFVKFSFLWITFEILKLIDYPTPIARRLILMQFLVKISPAVPITLRQNNCANWNRFCLRFLHFFIYKNQKIAEPQMKKAPSKRRGWSSWMDLNHRPHA